MIEPVTVPLDQIVELRKEKLQKLIAVGINAYPTAFAIDSQISGVHERFANLETGVIGEGVVTVAGRLISRREMGKAAFADISDVSGKIQLYFKTDKLGADSFCLFCHGSSDSFLVT